MKIIFIESPSERARICETVLRALPKWFGIESAVLDYIKDAQAMETWAADDGNSIVGFVSIHQHNQATAEVHVMGVLPNRHRQGVGRLLLQTVEKHLSRRGI